jgi:hypothetical protein
LSRELLSLGGGGNFFLAESGIGVMLATSFETMSASVHRWVRRRLPEWEAEGLITAEAARTLAERYPEEERLGLAQILIGGLGALLIGAGLIAVIGYNWDDFSNPVRLCFALGPLLLTQAGSLAALRAGERCPAWVREAAALLQAMAAGAAIALVAQIYHIGGEWPVFLLVWCLLSLPLAWTLRADSVAMFYLIGIAVWAAHQSVQFRPATGGAMFYPLLLAGLAPCVPRWRARGGVPGALRWVLAGSAAVGLAAASVAAVNLSDGKLYNAGFQMWTLIAAGMVLFPLSRAGVEESLARKPQMVLGGLWLLGFGLAATFIGASESMGRGMAEAAGLPWFWGLVVVVAGLAAVAVASRRWAALAVASIALLPLAGLLAGEETSPVGKVLLSWLATLHLSAMAVALILLDFAGKPGAPRLGATLLTLLIIGRMADSEFSLLTKGVGFILVGAGFLAFNLSLARLRRRFTSTPA